MIIVVVCRDAKDVGIVVKAGAKIGFSVMSPRDHWDLDKGKDIAIGRAFTKRKGRSWYWRLAVTRMVVETMGQAKFPLSDETLEKLANLFAVAMRCAEMEKVVAVGTVEMVTS